MFIDTGGWLVLIDETEQLHATAQQAYDAAHRRLTTSWVLDELVSLAQARRLARPPVLRMVAAAISDLAVEVVYPERSLVQDGLQLLWDRLDKTYSLCDAVSFAVMRTRAETEALTTDRHFEQEGFTRLLAS